MVTVMAPITAATPITVTPITATRVAATPITSASTTPSMASCVHSTTAGAVSRLATEMPSAATRATQRDGRGHQNRSTADYAKYTF
jgi:hypothetical protein